MSLSEECSWQLGRSVAMLTGAHGRSTPAMEHQCRLWLNQRVGHTRHLLTYAQATRTARFYGAWRICQPLRSRHRGLGIVCHRREQGVLGDGRACAHSADTHATQTRGSLFSASRGAQGSWATIGHPQQTCLERAACFITCSARTARRVPRERW